MSLKLSMQTLADARSSAAIPRYERASLTAGIVHFGVSNFYRAHHAVFVDELVNTGSLVTSGRSRKPILSGNRLTNFSRLFSASPAVTSEPTTSADRSACERFHRGRSVPAI
jgi:hypothetical protein